MFYMVRLLLSRFRFYRHRHIMKLALSYSLRIGVDGSRVLEGRIVGYGLRQDMWAFEGKLLPSHVGCCDS